MNQKKLKIAIELVRKGYSKQAKKLLKLADSEKDLEKDYKNAFSEYIEARDKLWEIRDKMIKNA